MARPLKEGLSYWPRDVDFRRNKKIKLLKAEFGVKGVYIFEEILDSLYEGKGYYKKWDEDDCLLMSEGVGDGCTPQLIAEVVQGCVRRSLFDKRVFDTFSVLTSRGIQEQFLEGTVSRSRIQIISEYWLLENEEVPANTLDKCSFIRVSEQKTRVFCQETRVSEADNPQSKVKKSKGKKSKESSVDKPHTQTKFIIPTLSEIEDYCRERNNDVDPKKFFDYFEANDWIDSKGKKVQSWKQKIITWEGGRGNGVSRNAAAGNSGRDKKEWNIETTKL